MCAQYAEESNTSACLKLFVVKNSSFWLRLQHFTSSTASDNVPFWGLWTSCKSWHACILCFHNSSYEILPGEVLVLTRLEGIKKKWINQQTNKQSLLVAERININVKLMCEIKLCVCKLSTADLLSSIKH